MTERDESDMRIGRALRAEYERQLKAFRENTPHYAHLESPSWDFGSSTVFQIIRNADALMKTDV